MPPAERLSRREREFMDLLYAIGDHATVADVRRRLSDAPSYSSVRATLSNLEAKGFVNHRVSGLRHQYSPTTSRATAQQQAVGHLIRVFFDGAARPVVATLLRQEHWTDSDLEALRAQIVEIQKNRRNE